MFPKMILVKKLKFYHLFCLSKTDREKVFGNVLDKKKKTLKTIRTCVYEERKINFFPKGKSIVFVKNLRFIQRSFSFKTDQEKLSGDVLVRKTFFCHPL